MHRVELPTAIRGQHYDHRRRPRSWMSQDAMLHVRKSVEQWETQAGYIAVIAER